MSARDWQPGDVAVDAAGRRMIRYERGWIDAEGDLRNIFTEVRPLAVIDPEAPIPDEWVSAFAYGHQLSAEVPWDVRIRSGLAALFAHIATPREPKPSEPTGDRATVRDRGGALWTRQNAMGGARPWFSPLADGSGWRDWSDLDVPADGVLFGGVE